MRCCEELSFLTWLSYEVLEGDDVVVIEAQIR